jgi:hypothetical protein
MLLTMHAAETDAQQRSSGGAAAPQNKEQAESGDGVNAIMKSSEAGALIQEGPSDVLTPCDSPWRKELTPTPHVPPLQEEEEGGSGAGWVAFGGAEDDDDVLP